MLYIGQLLVILHKIPLARKALLQNSGSIINQYGFNEDWWRGYIIDLTDEFSLLSESLQSFAHMTVETQRLIAFLDGGSHRPLACIDNLAVSPPLRSIPALKGEVSDINPVDRFLEDLVNFWGENASVTDIFESTVVNVECNEVQTFTNIVAEVSHSAASNGTLYDVVDELLWPYKSPPQSYLAKVSDVITLTLKREDAQSGAGIDVPLLFFPDRYTQPYLKYFEIMRQRQKTHESQLSVLTNKRFQVASYLGKDTSKLLKFTSQYLDSLTKRHEKTIENEDKGDFIDESDDEFDYTGLEAAAEDMKNVMQQYTSCYDGLVTEREQIQSLIDRDANLFKGDRATDVELFCEIFPGEECPEPRTFILSGVILSPTEYFFCRRKEKQLINLADDEDMSIKNSSNSTEPEIESAVSLAALNIYQDFQWYKVSKKFTDEGVEVPSAVEVMDPHEVITGAKTGSVDFGSQEAILVYATLENAWNTDAYSGYELSPQLKDFIERDRKSLFATMREQEAAAAAMAATVSTPSEGSHLSENMYKTGSPVKNAISSEAVNPDTSNQRLAPPGDYRRGSVSIRSNPSTYPSTPTGTTAALATTSMVSVKELSDTVSLNDDDDNSCVDSDSHLNSDKNIITKLIDDTDANAMELEFGAFRKI